MTARVKENVRQPWNLIYMAWAFSQLGAIYS